MQEALMFPGICAVLIIVAVPLMLRKVPPNCWYGFRTRKTMTDPVVWYKANRFLGWGLTCSSLVSGAVFTGVWWLPGVITPALLHEWAPLIFLLPVAVVLVASVIYEHVL